MTFSLIDVPDLETLTSLEPRAGSIWFGVSTLPAIYHALLRFLARGVKTGLVSSLQPLAGIMHFVMNHLGWGEHRGGMFVEVRGIDAAGRKTTRSWHMVAEGDVGPFVPAMAANFIVRRCLQIRMPAPGARPAQDALTLGDYESMFAQLGISTGERRSHIPEHWPLFRSVLGDAWNDLPAPIRKLHGSDGETSFKGRATVTRGDSVLSKIVARCIGFPQAAEDIPVTIRIDPSRKSERWHRVFAGHRFSSELFAGTGRRSHLVCEQIGPCRFDMALVADADRLYLRPGSWAFFGMPMPRYFLPSGAMYETVIDGKFSFHVEIRVPLIGHIVTYQGWFDTGD